MTSHNPSSPENTEWMLAVKPARTLHWIDALLLVAGYILLDWVSYFHPLHGLDITPWSPAPALGLVYILRFGWRAAMLVALANFVGDAGIHGVPLLTSALLAVLITAGYAVIGETLRHRLRSDEVFGARHDLFTWCAIVVAGTLLNSAIYISALVPLGVIGAADWWSAYLRHWIGDGVGILVSMPVFWMISSDRGRALLGLVIAKGETAAMLAVSLAALWVAFRLGADSHFKYLYILFLPVIWASAREGLPGAILIAAVIQAGVIFAMAYVDLSAISVLEIQMLMPALAILGFFVGVVVDEQRRASAELRQTLRLAAAGEMAGALAHELNQPLTALSAYAAACDKLLEQDGTGTRVKQAMRQIVAESERAGDVLTRLRDFFRTGATRLEPLRLRELLASSYATFAERARKQEVQLAFAQGPDCVLLADRLQLEVVMRNLITNAFDAVAALAPSHRRVTISAAADEPGWVRIQVEDSGPGLSVATAAHLFEPFESTKSTGMGLGLAISRAVVQAHGGRLWTEVGDHGVFKLLLPIEGSASHGNG